VGGGGGGGIYAGGGAGGVIYSTSLLAVIGETYNITVGNGGSSTYTGNYPASLNINGNGGNSSVIGQNISIMATGGGAGATTFTGNGGGAITNGSGVPELGNGYTIYRGANGGSGGGTGGNNNGTNVGGDFAGGLGISGQGNNGGFGANRSCTPSGGGGGAGAVGGSWQSRNGGIGIINPIAGSTVGELSAGNYWIGGGGSGASNTCGVNTPSLNGGLGGGGRCQGSGSFASSTATSGLANTGGGGGGGWNTASGSGGSGVVVITYQSPIQLATGGTVTNFTSGGNVFWIHTFTSNGTFIVYPDNALFTGWQNLSNRYQYLIAFDWDNCRMCPANVLTSDYITADGILYTSDPNFTNIDGLVVWRANGDGNATCVYASGNYAATSNWLNGANCSLGQNYIGLVRTVSSLRNGYLNNPTQSDNVKIGCGPNGGTSGCCANPSKNSPVAVLCNAYEIPKFYGVSGTVYATFFDTESNETYICGDISATTNKGKILRQAIRFTSDGIIDPTFDVTQSYNGNPFNAPPNNIKKHGNNVWISRDANAAPGAGTLTFQAQGNVTGHIHKVNLLGVRDTNFTPFTFSYTTTMFNYILVPAKNCIVMQNWLSIEFRKMTDGTQLAPPLAGGVNIHPLVMPSTFAENIDYFYVTQRTTTGYGGTPYGIKAVNLTSFTFDSTQNSAMGVGLNTADPFGMWGGKVSPNKDFLFGFIINSDSNNNNSYTDTPKWNTSSLVQNVFLKVNLPSYTAPLSSTEWQTTGNAVWNGGGFNGEYTIDSNNRIYAVVNVNNTLMRINGVNPQAYDLIRLNSDGTWDTSFSIKTKLNSGGNIYNHYLKSNSILICGDFTSYNGNTSKSKIIEIDFNGNAI
jgi:hypothetical protein